MIARGARRCSLIHPSLPRPNLFNSNGTHFISVAMQLNCTTTRSYITAWDNKRQITESRELQYIFLVEAQHFVIL